MTRAGWAKIIFRMTHGAGSPLINIRNPGRLTPEEEAKFAHWLASVARTRFEGSEFRRAAAAAGTADQGGHHRIRVAAARHLRPRYRRRCPGPGLVLDPPQLLCRPAQSRQRACRGIPRAAAAAGECAARHALDLRRSERHDLGLGELGAQHLDARSQHEGLQARALERPGAGQLADGRQLQRSTTKATSGAAARARSSRINGVDGSKMEAIKTKKFASTYGSAMSWDYRYFGGGAWPRDGVVIYDRKTGELYEAETSPNSGPARGEFDPRRQLLGGRPRRLADQVRHQDQARPRISAAHALYLALHRQGRQERRGLGRRAQWRALSALRSEDRAVHRLHAARAVQHGPRILDRQFHQPGLGLVRRPRWLAGAHPAAGLIGRLKRQRIQKRPRLECHQAEVTRAKPEGREGAETRR